ncbi:LytR/AlgR family response regulator transcription factor [Wenyingzhuangia sp. IMCC45467]
MAINALIIDDEIHNLENLEYLLLKHCANIHIIAKTNDVDKGIALIKQHKPDLVFLDIEMPGKNGFEVLENINPIHFEVIFVTAYNQYALKAIKFCALDYLMKPVSVSELKEAVNKVTEILDKKIANKKLEHLVSNYNNQQLPKKIALPTSDELFFVAIDDIIRCKSENNYTIFHLVNETTILVSKTLKEWDELLSAHHFIRTHQSHLVNSIHVKSYVKKDGGYILMNDGSNVVVSRHKKEEILNKLASFHKF